MKIAHIIFSLNIGGTESLLIDIINQQVLANPVFLIIINKNINRDLFHKIDKRVVVFCLNRKEGSRNPLFLLRFNWILKRIKASVLHCHNHKGINMIASYFKKDVLLTLHTTGVPADNLGKYQKLFAISEGVQKDIKDRTGILPELVYNGIDFTKIKPKKKSSAFRNVDFKLVQVGRLDHGTKGQHILIEAIGLLQRKGIINISLDFIGDGDSMDFLTGQVNQLKLNHKIRFLGMKNRSYIGEHLKDYDLLVQPSLIEGFGLTIVEAIFARIPVLVSNLEGPMEIIDKGKWGTFFEKGNVDALALNLLKIMHMNDDEKNDMTEGAYLYARARFDIHNTAKKYLAEYKEYV